MEERDTVMRCGIDRLIDRAREDEPDEFIYVAPRQTLAARCELLLDNLPPWLVLDPVAAPAQLA
jgi:hypothetical protein